MDIDGMAKRPVDVLLKLAVFSVLIVWTVEVVLLSKLLLVPLRDNDGIRVCASESKWGSTDGG